MHEFGTTREQLAEVRSPLEHGRTHPAAFKRDPITVDDVLAQPVISTRSVRSTAAS